MATEQDIDNLDHRIDWTFIEYMHVRRNVNYTVPKDVTFVVELSEYYPCESLVAHGFASRGMTLTYPASVMCQKFQLSLKYKSVNCIITALNFLLESLPIKFISDTVIYRQPLI